MMLRAARGVAFLCLSGCAATVLPSEVAGPEPSERAASSAGRAKVSPGEVLRAQVYVLGVEAADTTIVACPTAGSDLVRVHLKAASSGLAAMIRDVRMELETAISATNGLPQSDWSEVVMGEKRRHYDVHFSGGGYDYHYERSTGSPMDARIQSPDNTWVHDLLSAAIWMRSWRPEPRSRTQFYAVMGRHLWNTELTFKGPEVLVRQDGPEPALRYDGQATKLRPEPNEQAVRRFTVWFSDDPQRLPLRAVSESAFGEVRLETSSYEPHGTHPLCVPHASSPPVGSQPTPEQPPKPSP